MCRKLGTTEKATGIHLYSDKRPLPLWFTREIHHPPQKTTITAQGCARMQAREPAYDPSANTAAIATAVRLAQLANGRLKAFV